MMAGKPRMGSAAWLVFRLVAALSVLALSAVSDDAAAMNALKKAISGLNWTGPDVCGWGQVQCNAGKRVTSIQIGHTNPALSGTLPKELAELTALQYFWCDQNNLGGPFPYMPKSLQSLRINNNQFTSMPDDFFRGMYNLRDVSIGYNAFSPWKVPESLRDCNPLASFSGINASFTGAIPDFFGSSGPFQGLVNLALSFNAFEGGLPATFSGSSMETLWVNGQTSSNKLNGTLAVLQNMTSLKEIWVHGNSFTGTIPDFANHSQLSNVSLRDNQLTGPVPQSLVDLPGLQTVTLTNNYLQGPKPSFKVGVKVDMEGTNQFCTDVAGQECSPAVDALLSVAGALGYPLVLAQSWTGDDPCDAAAKWIGIVCNAASHNVTVIEFQNKGLSGTISPSFAKLATVTQLLLAGNNLTGTIPNELTTMPNLKKLDVSNNHLYGKVPKFRGDVVVITAGNPDIGKDRPAGAAGSGGGSGPSGGKRGYAGAAVGIVVGVLVLFGAGCLVYAKYGRKRKQGGKVQTPNAIVVHPRHSGDGDALKVSVAEAAAVGPGGNGGLSPASDVQHVEAGSMVISIQVLREVTDNFSEKNILGKGGFGTVYKGELQDGMKIAVKRMESGMIGKDEKGLTEFKSEIAVLTKVRHKHLVALLGHCLDGNERLLVYEHMSQGPLSKHLFDWKDDGLKPLDWKRRLIIALDVARGVEYLHGLAQQIFIHRDLKPSNILLGDDMRAKVSDFGLVRLAPEGQTSFETRLAGTFGYLAPEYAVTGRVTTKVDVYSYGVILMEMITGRKAIDNSQPEEHIHLVTWFRRMLLNKGSIRKVIDPAIDADGDEEVLASFTTVAELASHCCARDPNQRPDMGHVVNVIAPLVETWKPSEPNGDDIYGIDFETSLPEALSLWQASEGKSTMDLSSSSSTSPLLPSGDNTCSSIPTRPYGFADSFASSDGR